MKTKIRVLAALAALAFWPAAAAEMLGLWECAASIETGPLRWEFLPGGICLRLRPTPELGPNAWVYAKDLESSYEIVDGLLKIRWKNSAGNPGACDYRLEGVNGTAPVLRRVSIQTREEIAFLMSGKWRLSRMDNRELPTDFITNVLTFVEDGLVMVSRSSVVTFTSAGQPVWSMRHRLRYTLEGNRIHWEEHDTVFTAVIHQIDNEKMRCGLMLGKRGAPPRPIGLAEYRRVNCDLADDILGLWEGVSSSGYLVNGDHNFRIKFDKDGGYRYWHKTPKGYNIAPNDEQNNYCVDGDLLMTRWYESGIIERREWWLLKIEGDEMKFIARRRRFDGQMRDAEIVLRRRRKQ